MHESSLVAGLIGRLETLCREQGSARIVSLRVRLGALSHISPEHFRDHFEQAARGTAAEGARLDLEELVAVEDPHAQDVVLESVEVET